MLIFFFFFFLCRDLFIFSLFIPRPALYYRLFYNYHHFFFFISLSSFTPYDRRLTNLISAPNCVLILERRLSLFQPAVRARSCASVWSVCVCAEIQPSTYSCRCASIPRPLTYIRIIKKIYYRSPHSVWIDTRRLRGVNTCLLTRSLPYALTLAYIQT